MIRWNAKDALGGAAFVALGIYFVVASLSYGLGTARNIGPGYYPLGLGLASVGLGLFFLIGSLRENERLPTVVWRPVVLVLISIAAFGLSIERFGLVPAAFLTVCVAAAADRSTRVWQAALLGAFLALQVWLIFSLGLDLTIPAFAWVR